ncbi:transposase [Nonomuraea cypriaca]|uniref:transposase n=1 Tax=Nonomuraea cypriaca TaxID=1187855 RepID=UPI001A9C5A76|nr:transposase [Nonomuraea cypriaca]
MSMQPMPWPEPAPEVAAAIWAIYRGKRQVPLPVRVRDELGEVFADEAFVGAFGKEGRPGWSPGRLALITVLQRVGNLTDRQAAEAVATDLAWKYALGLGLNDPGFDASVLSEFRSRVIAHELEEKPLDLLLAALQERGLLAAGGKQRTDSTHAAPRGALSYPRFSREKLGGMFLGLMTYLNLKGEGNRSMSGKYRLCSGV